MKANSARPNTNRELTGSYVKGIYDDFLKSYGNEYAYYRWGRTLVSQYHYLQSKRVLLCVLSGHEFQVTLEVGGGDGVWTEIFAEHAGSIDFLDISEEMIKRAKRRIGNLGDKINYIHADFLKYDFINKKYDAILSFRNLEYFEDKERGVEKFAGILNKDGFLIIVTKSPEYDWFGYFKSKGLHKGQINILELKSLCEKNGLVVDSIVPAIIGKKLKWGFLRFFFDIIHRMIIRIPERFMPLKALSYISESFLLRARKK